MNFSEEYLRIQTSEVDSVGGAKPEPEERPMQRVLVSANGIPISLNNGTKPSDANPNAKNNVPGAVVASATVGDFANRLKVCGGCKHFDRAWWRNELARMKLSDDPVERQFVTTIYVEYSMQTNSELIEFHQSEDGEELDTEHAIQSLGVCKAYTHILHELGYPDFDAITIVHPIGTCPDMNMKTTPPTPWPNMPPSGNMYSPASKEAEQQMQGIRDEILLASEGKLR